MTDILPLALKEAEALGASDAEAYASTTFEHEVFIENNDLKQAKSQSVQALGIRVIVGRAAGFYAINNLNGKDIRRAAEMAVKMARSSPKDRLNSLPARSKVTPLRGIYDRRAAEFDAKDAIKMASNLLKAAKSHDSRISVDSGNFVAAQTVRKLINTNGIDLKERTSAFSWSIMGMALDGDEVSSFDSQSGNSHHVRDINVESTAKEFALTVVNSLGARKIHSFKGEMLLTPAAATELVEEVVANSVSSESVQKKSSQFAGKLDRQVSSELLTVEDDATNTAGLAAASFDREGVPHSKNVVIEKGVLKKFLYNTYTARKDGVKSTGNAAGSTNAPPSVSTTNFIISPCRSSLRSLVSEIRRGMMVSRFSGNVNTVTGDFSGVVKGGRIIEDGELGHAAKEVMVAGNVFECLKNLTGVSLEQKVIHTSILPYLRFAEVSFTGG